MSVHAFQGFGEGIGKVSLFDQVRSHFDDEVHGLDAHGASDRAGLASGAIPEFQFLSKTVKVLLQNELRHQAPDIQFRLPGDRAASGARPALKSGPSPPG